MPQEAQPAERRAYLPLAYDVERLVATLMSPNASLNRRLAAAERLYTLMPTYIRRMLYEAAIKLVGKDALTGDADKDARRNLFKDALEDMLEAMEETRQRIVEVKLPPITVSKDLLNGDVPNMIKSVAKALSGWFYAATEEARKKGNPYSEDPSAPGYVQLITFASLVIVNGLRQLALIGG
jgi:phage terminase large subunit-like protein